MTNVIPHCAKVVHLVPPSDKDIYMYSISCSRILNRILCVIDGMPCLQLCQMAKQLSIALRCYTELAD